MADDHVTPSPTPVPPETPSEAARYAPGLNGRAGRAPAPARAATPAPAPRRGLWRTLWGSSPAPSPAQGQHADSVREVVETVVFVVVLVLLLKSFAAEAFVIPTGSMAQTLWGYQKVVTCPDCGVEFPVNCSCEVDPTDGHLEPVIACTCPSCRQHIYFNDVPERYPRDVHLADALEGYVRNNPTALGIKDPGWNSGDRVLVAKFVYDLLHRDPGRLDVVVFKYPGDYDFPRSGPYKNNVPMNYIKRLIGLPGETIAVHNGNVYVLAPDLGLKYKDYDEARAEELAGRPELMARLWQKEFMHVDSETSKEFWRKGQFQIIRKSPETLLAMMRLVYDNDHPAGRANKQKSAGPRLSERWRGAVGWQAEGRGFLNEGGDKESWLRYSHLVDREQPTRPELITDFMGYNTFVVPSNRHQNPGENWVGDLILECEVTLPDRPAGELTLELSEGVDRFRARWDLGSGDCTLLRVQGGQERPLETKPTGMNRKGTYRLRFANVDDRLTVWVDGRLPFDTGVTYQPPPPEDEGPRQNDLEPAGVGVRGAAGVKVAKLRLFRDTYYTANAGSPSTADVSGVDFANPGTWSALKQRPVLTMYVQPGHYLCMGDNSPESSDGRSWGTVPQRLLLGRAVMVYYPFGRAGRIR
jgi:signal peptidase I